MAFDVKELLLSDTYHFDVTVHDAGVPFAGALSLSPHEITLRVMGERSMERSPTLSWKDSDSVVCSDVTATYILGGLRFRRGRNANLERTPPRSFFEATFDVAFVVYLPQQQREDSFLGVELFSSTVDAWVGGTKKQEEILRRHSARDASIFHDRKLLTEFRGGVGSTGQFGLSYSPSASYSPQDFRSELRFPPCFWSSTGSNLTARESYSLVCDLYTLLAFLTGDEIELEKVRLPSAGRGLPSNPATLYFRTDHARRSTHSLVLFPLGHDLRYDTLHLPPLPLQALEAFFALDPARRRRFEKYVRYRRLQNVEERFLGYFRLLERLTEQRASFVDEGKLEGLIKRARQYLVRTFADKKGVDGFLRGLPRFNRMKFNTERCLAAFLDELPEESLKRWKFGKGDLANICKWRNDLSHANEHGVDKQTAHDFTAFVEAMLVVRLLAELGVTYAASAVIVERLSASLRII